MKICRFGDERVGVVKGETVIDVTEVAKRLPAQRWPFPIGDQFLAALPELNDSLERAAQSGQVFPISGTGLLSPVANPSKIIGIGRIYMDHAEEAGLDPEIARGNSVETNPDTIRMVMKATTALVGPSEGVPLRFLDRRNDHEIEFAVIIGRKCTDIRKDSALDYVAGYSIGLDMTLRGPELPSSRKSIDGYCVLGPWLTTSDEVPNPGQAGFSLYVNGELRQQANTSQLAFDIPSIIENASSFYTLYPGDIILTGTPGGVGPVRPGDVIDVECEYIGKMSVEVRAHQPEETAK